MALQCLSNTQTTEELLGSLRLGLAAGEGKRGGSGQGQKQNWGGEMFPRVVEAWPAVHQSGGGGARGDGGAMGVRQVGAGAARGKTWREHEQAHGDGISTR